MTDNELIAALYEALDAVMREIVGYDYHDEDGICAKAMEALAAARGEQAQ